MGNLQLGIQAYFLTSGDQVGPSSLAPHTPKGLLAPLFLSCLFTVYFYRLLWIAGMAAHPLLSVVSRQHPDKKSPIEMDSNASCWAIGCNLLPTA